MGKVTFDLPSDLERAIEEISERNGRRVLTLDMRHFGVVAREGTLILAPGWDDYVGE